MMPDRKRMILVGLLSIVALIAVILIIYVITLFSKEKNIIGLVSDPYPNEVTYFGIIYDENNKYQKIVPLNSNFEALEYTLNSFYEIQDTEIINDKLVIYSDAVNEIGYKSDTKEFFLNEVNSYYNSKTIVKLAKDYIVFLTGDGNLEYRSYGAKADKENEIVASDITNRKIAVINNLIYYRAFEGITVYDLDTKESRVVVPISDAFSPEINDYNDRYILLGTKDEFMLLGVHNDKITKLNEKINVDNYSLLSLYKNGIVYAVYNPNKLVSFNAFYDRFEEAPYLLEEGYVVNNMYYINDNNCFIHLVSANDEHKYIIFDVVERKIKATLDVNYQDIIQVK